MTDVQSAQLGGQTFNVLVLMGFVTVCSMDRLAMPLDSVPSHHSSPLHFCQGSAGVKLTLPRFDWGTPQSITSLLISPTMGQKLSQPRPVPLGTGHLLCIAQGQVPPETS